jgi:GNAT superfamily N-acetyltransferase
MAIEDKTSYETIVLNNYNEVMNFYNQNPEKLKEIFSIFDNGLYLWSHKISFRNWLSDISNNPKTTIILVNKNKEMIGAIYGYDSPNNKTFNLSMFAVKKEHQGKLYGTKLMARAFAIIFRKGYEKIEMLALKKTRIINKYLTGQLSEERWKKRKFKSGFKYVLISDPQIPSVHNITKQKIPKKPIVK